VYFTMSANHFTPTWNPLTNKLQSYYFVKHLLTLPFWRFLTNPDVLLSTTASTSSQLYLYTSCDANDQFGLNKGHTWLANEIICAGDSTSPGTTCAAAKLAPGGVSTYTPVVPTTSGAISGGYLYESHGTGGHTFSETDMEHALKFFSDIFYTLGDAGSMSSKSGTVAMAFANWKTAGDKGAPAAKCGEYLGAGTFTWYWVGGLNPTCTVYTKPAYDWGDKEEYMFKDIETDAITFDKPSNADAIRESYRVLLSVQHGGKMAVLDMLDEGVSGMGTIDTYFKGSTTIPADYFVAAAK